MYCSIQTVISLVQEECPDSPKLQHKHLVSYQDGAGLMAAGPGCVWIVCGANHEGGVQAVFWMDADVGVGCAN